jgi:hypothetical protein
MYNFHHIAIADRPESCDANPEVKVLGMRIRENLCETADLRQLVATVGDIAT